MSAYFCSFERDEDTFEEVDAGSSSTAAIAFYARHEGGEDYCEVFVRDGRGVVTQYRVARRTEYDVRQVRQVRP